MIRSELILKLIIPKLDIFLMCSTLIKFLENNPLKWNYPIVNKFKFITFVEIKINIFFDVDFNINLYLSVRIWL